MWPVRNHTFVFVIRAQKGRFVFYRTGLRYFWNQCKREFGVSLDELAIPAVRVFQVYLSKGKDNRIKTQTQLYLCLNLLHVSAMYIHNQAELTYLLQGAESFLRS